MFEKNWVSSINLLIVIVSRNIVVISQKDVSVEPYIVISPNWFSLKNFVIQPIDFFYLPYCCTVNSFTGEFQETVPTILETRKKKYSENNVVKIMDSWKRFPPSSINLHQLLKDCTGKQNIRLGVFYFGRKNSTPISNDSTVIIGDITVILLIVSIIFCYMPCWKEYILIFKEIELNSSKAFSGHCINFLMCLNK